MRVPPARMEEPGSLTGTHGQAARAEPPLRATAMSIHEHLTQFAGKPVVDWEPGAPIAEPEAAVYRIRLSWEEAEEDTRWTDKLATFLQDPAAGQVAGLVVGAWGKVGMGDDSSPIVEALVAAGERLVRLKALFFGDIIGEESEISWIRQSDVSPLFNAYPALEHFGVRGGQGLSLGALRLDRLRTLIVQSGGLPATVLEEVATAELPELEHLELWLGEDQYGADFAMEQLEPILSGERFPKLRYLGLRDSDRADEVAAVVASAPILERIQVLDMSLGTLGDDGAAALLASPAVARLEKLDLHHHFCSQETVRRLEGLGIEVDASEPQEAEEFNGDVWRYVAVGE
jgi:hypothetical protein